MDFFKTKEEVRMSSSCSIWQSLAAVIARILISYLFLSAGVSKILHFSSTVSYIGSHGMPMPAVLAIIALLIEIIGGLMVLLGIWARLGALALAIFVIVITPIFHAYWNAPVAEVSGQMNNFFKNGAILGGLLYVIAFGAGRIAFIRCKPSQRT
jgi:putative oxidoreductase